MVEPLKTVKGVAGKEIAVYDNTYDNSKMDQEGFLKVLLANFKYQDPFEAEDIGKFIDNTVKLRELEVLNNFENSVNNLTGSTQQLLEAANMIDKKVLYEGRSTFFENGKSEIAYSFDEQVDYAALYVYDMNGDVVYQKELQNLQGDDIQLEIPDLEDGYYNIAVIAKRGDEDVMDVSINSTALVEGVERDSEGITLLTGAGSIKLEDVYKIGG